MRLSLHSAVIFLAGICVVGSFPINVRAQVVPWAMGAYGAMQACPYDTRVAGGAYSRTDEEKRIATSIRDRDTELTKFKRDKSNAESKKRSAAAVLRKAFKGNFADFLIERHLDGQTKCSEYRGYNEDEGSAPSSIGTIDPAKKKAFIEDNRKPIKGKIEVKVEFAYEWLKGYCDNSQEGGVYYEVCADTDLRDSDSKRVTEKDCKEAIVNYRKAQKEYTNATSDAERADRDIKELETSLTDARDRANESAARRQRGETTEARCEDCERSINGPAVAANFLTGAAATLIGYSANKQVIQANSQLGWPTNATPSALSYGFPYILNGIYGALGGQMGVGGFGCGGGVGGTGYPYGPNGMMGYPYGMNGAGWNPNGGALGYPYDMYGNPINGGMFMPGLGTWGNNGINGLGNLGLMYPGAMMGGVVGGVLGNNMLGGALGNNMLGGALGNNMLGGALGNNMLGGALGNNMMGGVLGNNMMGGVLGNMMNGNMMNGGPLNNGMYNPQLMQLQQQMLQQQAQFAQQQQQAYAQYMQQFQLVQYQKQVQLQGLYQELYSLNYRIEMIKNGYVTGSMGTGGVLNGSVGGVLNGGIGGVLSGGIGGVLSGGIGGVVGGIGGAVTFGTVTNYIPPTGSATTITVPGRGR